MCFDRWGLSQRSCLLHLQILPSKTVRQTKRGWIVFAVIGWLTGRSVSIGADSSFAQFVPADVRAFAEVYDLAGLADHLGQNGAWGTWTQLVAGQTLQPGVTVEWGQRVGRILGMSLAEAARDLFGRQVAVAAPSHEDLAEGVVLARAPDDKVIASLIARNQAKPQLPIAGVPCYTLREGLSLAVKDGIIVLGQRAGQAGLFEKTVTLLSGEGGPPRLSTSPEFVEQVARLPSGTQGVLYLDLPSSSSGSTTRGERSSGSMWRSEPAWSSFRRLTVGLYDREGGLDLRIRGVSNRPIDHMGPRSVPLDSLGRLPRSTLLVWARTAGLTDLYRQALADRNPEGLVVRSYLELVQVLLRPADLEKDLLAKLGPQVMLVWGRKTDQPTEAAEPIELPLLSVLIESKEAEAISPLLQRLGERFLGWMKVEYARAKQTLDLSVEQTTHRGVVIYRMAIGSLFKGNTLCPYLTTLELSWAGTDGWLVISTHPDHIRQIIDARTADPARTFADTKAFKSIRQHDGITSLVVMQPTAIADLLQSWVDYCSRHAPRVLEPLWWKRMVVRRSGRRAELGIIMKEGSEPGRVTVASPVLPEMPATGRLMPGDKICAVDGVSLSEDHPEEDLRDLVALRRDAGVVLRVERAGKLLDVRIPLPPPPPLPVAADWDPVRSIRHLISLGKNFEVLGYLGTEAASPLFDATLVLRVHSGLEPVAPAHQTQANNQPATSQVVR